MLDKEQNLRLAAKGLSFKKVNLMLHTFEARFRNLSSWNFDIEMKITHDYET
jgi:hypothetical protein